MLVGVPSLEFHVRWRGACGVDLKVLGGAARRRYEREMPAVWAYEMAHAVPLQLRAEIGEAYRAEVARRFAAAAGMLARGEYERFRQARNESVAMLPRDDKAAQMLTAAVCARAAARFILLAAGAPYPSDKWLLEEVGRTTSSAGLATVARAALEPSLSPAARFDALWELWQLVDRSAEAETR